MMRLRLKPFAWGVMSLLVVSVASAESQRTESVIYADDDAGPYLQMFKPMLSDPKMRMGGDSGTPELQSKRLQSGAYSVLMVRFDVHRTGAAVDAPAVLPGRLPDGADDIATLVTCGQAKGGGDYVATVETQYRRYPKGWQPEAFRYQQVKDCAGAMQAYAKQ